MKGMAGWHTTANFQQIAATSPSGPWERRDVDLWNWAFSGCQRRPYGQHCFGSTHLSEECRHSSSLHQGKSLKLIKVSHNQDLSRVEFFSSPPLLMPRVQVYTCLHGLLKGPVL